ncbi:MAG TPA: type II toxin-antitoxin system RelE/ParE family toxin [Thermoanaerobaculia bacterium]|nr:type II toxin-antitoxin system RelE/ParE family toxin [Thermoanaerobaculia bacterium]
MARDVKELTESATATHTRAFRVRRYTVAYRISNNTIVIAAVAHHSREPGFWRERD